MIRFISGCHGVGMTFQNSTAAKPKTIGWQNVHALAVQSMAIVVGCKPVPKAWAFKVDVVDFGDVAGGWQGEAAAPDTAQKQAIPCGNYGDNLTGACKSE